MNKTISREPPEGAPEGTVWFGGPVDRWRVALRVYGEDLDPGATLLYVSQGDRLLGWLAAKDTIRAGAKSTVSASMSLS